MLVISNTVCTRPYVRQWSPLIGVHVHRLTRACLKSIFILFTQDVLTWLLQNHANQVWTSRKRGHAAVVTPRHPRCRRRTSYLDNFLEEQLLNNLYSSIARSACPRFACSSSRGTTGRDMCPKTVRRLCLSILELAHAYYGVGTMCNADGGIFPVADRKLTLLSEEDRSLLHAGKAVGAALMEERRPGIMDRVKQAEALAW
jgi:hypothetical protein